MINLTNSKLRHRYHCQRNSAFDRGIDWDLTFDSWLKIWTNSGHLEQRGRGVGMYCMSRYGDIGPYSETNVFIQLWTKNTSDAHRGVPKLSKRGLTPWNKGLTAATDDRVQKYSGPNNGMFKPRSP